MNVLCKAPSAGNVGRAACAVVLAVGLGLPPCGLAYAGEGSVAAGAISADAGASSIDAGVSAQALDKDALLDAARAADVGGVDALEKYLDGDELSDDELLGIDADALADIDAALADDIARLQRDVRERAGEAGAGDAVDGAGEPGEPGGADGADEATAADGAGACDAVDGAGEPGGADDADEATAADGAAPSRGGGAGGNAPSAASSAGDGTQAVSSQETSSQGTSSQGASSRDASSQGVSSQSGASRGASSQLTASKSESLKAAEAPGLSASVGDGADGNGAADAARDAETGDGGEEHPAYTYDGDTTLAPRAYPINLTTAKFIAVIGEPARALAEEHDLYASVMIAQAILESGSGGSGLSQPPYFNLFGIKGAYEGQSVTMSTQEDDGTGSYYTIDAAFRRYPSYAASLQDYAELLSKPFYAGARKQVAEDYVAACEYLQGRYATSTSYAASLRGIIEAYDLTRYDEPLGFELVDSYKAVVDVETGDVLAWGDAGVVEYADALGNDEPGDALSAGGLDAGVQGGDEQDADALDGGLDGGGRVRVAVEERGIADLVSAATGKLGQPYVWGGTGPLGFDCSGLVWSSYREALGVELPRTTYFMCLRGEDVDFANLRAGDLVFFDDGKGHANHVGMYLGEGCYLESTTGGVQVTAMEERTPTFAKRVLPMREVVPADDDAGAKPTAGLDAAAGLDVPSRLEAVLGGFFRLGARLGLLETEGE